MGNVWRQGDRIQPKPLCLMLHVNNIHLGLKDGDWIESFHLEFIF
jgi:hypothetical protein